MIEASVIVPFYGDVTFLLKCLDSLKDSTLDPERFEVLIVDNHERKRLPEDFYPPYRIVHQSIPGSYAARNKGIAEAQGKYLFFTDADTTVAPDWLEKGLDFLKARGPCLAGGKIVLKFQNPEGPTALEHYERIFYFQQKHYVEKEGYAATANLFGSAAIFNHLQGFDSALRSGGDQEFCQRATRLKNDLHYCDSAVVYHPSRPKLKEFLIRRLRAFSGNLYLFYRKKGLNWKMVKEKLRYFLDSDKFREWNGDWEYYDRLSLSQQDKVKSWHRFLCWVDILTLLYCKSSYRRLKKLTLIDRR